VVYNNHIHHGGDSEADYENDVHGVAVACNDMNIWVLDNHIHHMGGDSVQVSHGCRFSTDHVYIGRNIMHDDRENAVDIKQANDVIVSQNIMYNYEPCSSSSGEVFVVHYDPNRIWVLYNEVYNGNLGIASTGSSNFNVIGNIVYNITNMSEHAGTDCQYWSGVGMRFYNTGKATAFNNVFYDSHSGIGAYVFAGSTFDIGNNIFMNLEDTQDTRSSHMCVGGNSAALQNSFLNSNIYYQNGEAVKITWGSSYPSVSSLQSAMDKCSNCIEADPQFVDAVNGNFRLASSDSPAVDSGVLSDVYAEFENLYELDIAKDIDGNPRPLGEWDIGAFEFQGPVCVDMSALLNFISQWRQGSITMPSVISKLAAWKSGEGC